MLVNKRKTHVLNLYNSTVAIFVLSMSLVIIINNNNNMNNKDMETFDLSTGIDIRFMISLNPKSIIFVNARQSVSYMFSNSTLFISFETSWQLLVYYYIQIYNEIYYKTLVPNKTWTLIEKIHIWNRMYKLCKPYMTKQ